MHTDGEVGVRVLVLGLLLLLGAVAALLPGSFVFGTLLSPGFVRWAGYENLLLLAHLGVYGGLVVVWVWVWGRLLTAAAGVFAFSLAMEGLQALTSWREGSFADVLLNLVAVLLGVGTVLLVRALRVAWLAARVR